MARKELRHKAIHYILLTVVLLIFYFLLGSFFDAVCNHGNAQKIEDWTIRLNAVGQDSIEELNSKKLVVGDCVVISKSIDMGEDYNTMCFSSKNAMIRVFFDSQLIYSFGEFDSEKEQYIGTEYHVVSLKGIRSDGWKQPLKIEYHIVTPNQRDIFSDVYIGNAFDTYLYMLSENIENLVLCILVLGMGIIFAFFTFIIDGTGTSKKDLLFLSLTIISIGLWGIFRTGFVASFLKTNYYFYKCAEYVSFLIIPSFLLLYYGGILSEAGRKIRMSLGIMIVVLLPYQIFVLVSVLKDAEYATKLDMITYILYAAVMTYIVIISIWYRRNSSYRNINVYGIIFFGVVTIYSIIQTAISGKDSDSMNLLQYGMLVFAIALLYGYLINTMKIKEIYQKNEILSQIAFIDPLTVVNNRAKYEKDIAEYKDGEHWGVIFFDLNNLKKYNDEFGHEMGDLLIASFAEVLKNSVRASEIYRVGGDEFVVILRDITRKQVGIVLDKINTNIDKHNQKKKDVIISVAYGIEDTIDNEYDIETAVKLADEKMYEMKKKSKMGRA